MGNSQWELDRLGAKHFRGLFDEGAKRFMNFFDECASTKRETWLDHPGYLKIGDETVKLKCSPIEGKQ